MRTVLLYSVLLILGLLGSQLLPVVGESLYPAITLGIKILTMVCLAYIMIHIGLTFTIDKANVSDYAWDYVVAATAAAFPWLFCAAYFVWVLPSPEGIDKLQLWKEALLAGRFAAPTSAGVLFSMLAAAGLGATWLYRKARILAIFDDLDTILLMIPLKIFLIGFSWEMVVVVVIITSFLWAAWRWMHQIPLPITWGWMIIYSIVITAATEALAHIHHFGKGMVPIAIEVLLPAFVLGVTIARPKVVTQEERRQALHTVTEETQIASIISAIFMFLVGLSMPPLGLAFVKPHLPTLTTLFSGAYTDAGRVTLAGMSGRTVALHVLCITILANLGKMFPAFCYRKEASFRERLALAIGMWPRAEVGAGIIVISISFGIGGPMITVALFSLVLNLILTGPFILLVKLLMPHNPQPSH